MRTARTVVTAAGVVLVLVASADVAAAAPSTLRVSVSSAGAQGNSDSYTPAISADGRFVTYFSRASNLVPGDSNGTYDVFVYDRSTRATTRVSVGSNGAQANGESSEPAISADGRYVAYQSRASNLVPGDTNGARDVFVHDRVTRVTARVSVTSTGGQGTGGYSYEPAISGDGRYVTYDSIASNLVSGDTNGWQDAFLYDRWTRRTTRVSVGSNGEQANGESSEPAISADGRYIAYRSDASNLVSGDTNSGQDAFLYDRFTRRTTRVSVSSAGTEADSASLFPTLGALTLSADNRYITYSSAASNLVPGDDNGEYDIFLYERSTRRTTRVSVASDGAEAIGGYSAGSAISTDGRYVSYSSYATNLVPGDTNGTRDVFLYDRSTRRTTRPSIASSGAEGNNLSHNVAMSADGRYIAYGSDATNLLPGDTNGRSDVFVWQRY